MAIRVLKEVNRLPGYAYASTLTIIAGQPVLFQSTDVIRAYNSSTLISAPIGFAAESTSPVSSAPVTIDGMVGAGFDYPNYARGGMVGVFINGGVFEMYDDGRGSPLKADTFALNEPVYVTYNGLISNTTTASIGAGIRPIGSVMAVSGSGATLKVTIKSLI